MKHTMIYFGLFSVYFRGLKEALNKKEMEGMKKFSDASGLL